MAPRRYTGVGAGLKLLFKKEKQATIDILEERFSSVSGSALPSPTRFERGAQASSSPEAEDDDEGGSAPSKGKAMLRPKTSPVDLGVDRVSLLSALPKGTLALVADANWKTRAEGLEKIQTTLQKCGPITPDLGDLTSALIARLKDHQRNLVSTTLAILAEIATAMGPSIVKYAHVPRPSHKRPYEERPTDWIDLV